MRIGWIWFISYGRPGTPGYRNKIQKIVTYE